GERYPLALARKCANQEGEVVKEGSTTIWYSGWADPVPMIREQTETARGRFGSLLGESAVSQPPVRILCFHERSAYVRSQMRLFPGIDFASMDGLHLGRPHHLSTLCTDEA